MILVGIDGFSGRLTTLTRPNKHVIALICQDETHFSEFPLQGRYAVSLLNPQAGKAGETERNAHATTCNNQSLGQIGRVYEVIVKDRKSTRLNSSHANISYAVFCLKKKKTTLTR